ncbi:MAG: extracellular solute-binding protein [Clostridia bacterium]|nr:extracellular solute-binding protein [Clostridia bacterium]
MKANLTRILCLVLALMMSVALFTACGDDEAESPTDVESTESVVSTIAPVIVDVDEDAPYTIAQSKDGKDVVILTPNEDGTITMTVAEKTTLEAFLACVTAKEGYAIKVSAADGKEVTDTKAVIAKDMVFEVFKDGSAEAEVKMAINVVAQDEIEETVKEQEQIDNNTPAPDQNSGNGNNPSSQTGNTPSAIKSEITLSTIWYDNYNGNDSGAKAWKSTFKTMEEKQGIKTNFAKLDSASATDTIVKDVMAGKVTADVFDVSLAMCRNIARKKAAANIYDSKTLNKSLYACGATESVTFGGKAYGVTFASKSVNPMGVMYNKKLIQKYAPETDIIKLYNEKKWTFEAFQTLAKKCTVDTDGNNKADIYGFTSNTNIIGMALSSNAGGTALMKNGRVEATMCNDAGVAALEWCKELFKTDRSWLYKADINVCADAFANGEAAMFVSYMQFYPTIASKADFNLGFVLMPIGPAQKDYVNSVYDAALYVVPKTNAKRLDDIGTWLNGVANVSGKLLNNSLTKLANNGMDETCRGIYKSLVNNMCAEFSTGAFTANISSQVDSSVTAASKSPAKVMAAIKSAAQKELDDFYGPLYS